VPSAHWTARTGGAPALAPQARIAAAPHERSSRAQLIACSAFRMLRVLVNESPSTQEEADSPRVREFVVAPLCTPRGTHRFEKSERRQLMQLLLGKRTAGFLSSEPRYPGVAKNSFVFRLLAAPPIFVACPKCLLELLVAVDFVCDHQGVLQSSSFEPVPIA